MKILVLHSSSDLYGASKVLLQTVGYLVSRNHDVIVILSEEGPLADAFRQKGINVHIIKLGILRRKYFNISGIFNRMVTIRKAKKKLSLLVKEQSIDVIYSNTTAVLAGALVAKKKKIYHIWHIHEIITKPGWVLKILGRVVNRYSDQVIVVSEAVKKNWKKYVSENKIKVVYNGLEYKEYMTADGNEIRKKIDASGNHILVGMIGRIHYWKGQEYFLNIAKHLVDKYQNLKFVMVGDVFPGYEYLYDELEKTKIQLGISHLVVDLGYRRDIPQILSALDVFVLPSILPDPLATVVLEAMAAGKPVAATAHGGVVEIIQNNISGVLIPWNDAYKASEIIGRLIVDKPLRSTLGRNSVERVLTFFSQEAYFQNLEKIFSQPLN